MHARRSLVLAALTAVALTSTTRILLAQNQRWDLVLADTSVAVSWEQATLVRQDANVVRVWIRSEFMHPHRISTEDPRMYQRSIVRYDFDCARKTSRIVQSNWYDPAGTLLLTTDQVSEWKELVPSGNDGSTLLHVCEASSSVTAAPSGTPVPPTLPPGVQPSVAARDGHSGFHAAFGVGSGSLALVCDGCSTDRTGSVSFFLMFGGAIRPSWVLSGELEAWSKQDNGGTGSVSWLNVVAQWYPHPTGAFYLKFGAGLAVLDATLTIPGYQGESLRVTSPGALVGVGADIHMSRGFSLSPYLNILYAVPEDVSVNGTSSGVNVGATLVHIGLAAAWR
jgi:hypothetical protein